MQTGVLDVDRSKKSLKNADLNRQPNLETLAWNLQDN